MSSSSLLLDELSDREWDSGVTHRREEDKWKRVRSILKRPLTSLALLSRLVQVIQRREDGTVNFFRGWESYREGFGKITGEHWLGKWLGHLCVCVCK